jgi:hypothetical protein
MIDIEYLKKGLSFAKSNAYNGFTSDDLLSHLEGKDCDDEKFNKFVYHMDESWSAGLYRRKSSSSSSSGWGLTGSSSGYSLIAVDLVLTPAGDSLLSELNTPKGLQKLAALIKKGSGIAGVEAFKYALQQMFSG